jgi:hypothetical protein
VDGALRSFVMATFDLGSAKTSYNKEVDQFLGVK